MIFEHQSKNRKVLLAIFAVLLISGISYLVWSKFSYKPEPIENTNAPWQTFTDDKQGISFRYPENPFTKYMEAIDWPPQIQVLSQPFTCTEAGLETDRAGQTLKRMVDDRTYCVTKVTEGAAGSVYTQYAYAFPKDNKTAIFTFSVRYDQCGNYDELKKTECENLRTAFDLDGVIDRVAQTLQVEITSPKTSDSGIRGMVLLGPTCPVVMAPPDPQCADKPYKTSLVVTTVDGARVIKQFSSDDSGKFEVKIQPGEYAIRSAAAANILPYCASNGTVRVNANSYTETTVSCDTGIR